MKVAEVLAPAVGDKRTPESSKYDVRKSLAPDTSWLETFLFPPVTFDSTTWPAIDSVSHSFKTLDRGKLDTRSVPTPLFSWIERGYGCPQGPYFPSSVVNDAGVGDVAWSNPGNATQSDDVYASVVTVAQTSQRLNATIFNFNLSPFKRVDGILVEVEGKVLAGTDTITIRMIKNGVISATGFTGDLSTTEAFISFGGSTNLLGENWLTTDLNSSTSGVSIRLESGVSATTSIDSVRMTAYCSDLITPPNGGFVTQRASAIDVKNIHLPILPWLYPIVDAETASRIPIFDQELSSFRSRDRNKIEVQRIWEPDIHWLFSSNFLDPQLWPGIDELLRSFRTPPPKILNVANVQQPVFSWEYPVVDGINAQQWPGVEELLRSFRVGGDRYINTRSITEPAFTWDYPVVDAFNASLVPIWAQESSSIRTKEPSKIILGAINEPDISWLNFFLSPVFDVTLWPAIEQLLRSFRAGDPAKIDLRSIGEPQFSWFYPTVDSFNAIYSPVFAELLASFFTLAGKKINVTSINQPDTSWLGQFLAPTFNANLWPAIEELLRAFRSTERAKLNVRAVNEPDFTSWYLQAAEMFAISNGGDRTLDSSKIDVRRIVKPNIDWLFNFLTPAFDQTLWPAIEQLLRSYRVDNSKKIVLGSVIEPVFSWFYPTLDAIVAQNWPAIEQLLRSFVSSASAKIRVGAINEPIFSWSYPTIDAIIAQNWPAIEELLRALRTRQGNMLNVRSINEPSDAWLTAIPPTPSTITKITRRHWRRGWSN